MGDSIAGHTESTDHPSRSCARKRGLERPGTHI